MVQLISVHVDAYLINYVTILLFKWKAAHMLHLNYTNIIAPVTAPNLNY